MHKACSGFNVDGEFYVLKHCSLVGYLNAPHQAPALLPQAQSRYSQQTSGREGCHLAHPSRRGASVIAQPAGSRRGGHLMGKIIE
eukprot:gene14638-biopygen18648